MVVIKPGASIEGLRPEMAVALDIIEKVFSKYDLDTVVTEGTGGKHMKGSKHYEGLALDLRSKHVLSSSMKYEILYECQKELGNEFDMILESPDTDNEHFHAEFDPKYKEAA